MNIKTESLNHYLTRPISGNLVDLLKADIEQNGYYGLSPLVVGQKDDECFVLCGNHRLTAARDLDIKELPCTVIDADEDDWLRLAIRDNEVNKTLKQDDLFDWLFRIGKEKERGLTQVQIGERVGWSVQKVSDYAKILKISAQVLSFAENHQEGRADKKSATADFNFTEGWFRSTGMYDLNSEDQAKFMDWFITERKCKATASMIKDKTILLVEIENQLDLIDETLSPEISTEDKERLIASVKKGEFSTKRLADVIEGMNQDVKSKAVFGLDALKGLESLMDNSVDVVVTDPPYGVDYVPSRATGNPSFEDGKDETLKYLDLVFAEIKRVCKENAHIYCFSGWVNLFEVREIMKKYFDVPAYNLTWKKNNHTPCDFKTKYASNDEQIIFCTMPKGKERKLNGNVSRRVMDFDIPQNKVHDCQKPVDLLKYLIGNSSSSGEVVLDPFMGSGATMLAASQTGRHYIGFEIETKYEPGFKRSLG